MTPKVRLIIGVCLALLTAVLLGVYSYKLRMGQQSETFLRLSPDVAVAQGTTIPDTALQTMALPESAGALVSVAIKDTEENRQWLKGRRASRDVQPGSLLLYNFFADQPAARFGAKITQGKRAISLEVDAAAAVSFLIEPGSHVDIVGTLSIEGSPRGGGVPSAENTARRLASQTILQNVRVLAVGSQTSRGAYADAQDTNYATVTVEVSPIDAERLAFARANLANGQLTLLLRNPADDAIAVLPPTTWTELQSPPSGS
jgi:pilus assembly protein CpaB